MSQAQSRSISQNARDLAVLNMAIADAAIAVMETKYFYHFWRPVTAIRAGDTDGNPRTEPDAAFTPLITTPSFPSFPSAHASASYAGREVLERIYGSGTQAITLSHPGRPGVILNYQRFSQITGGIDDARVYGGIHFRFDQEEGALQGRNVGRYIHKHHLRCANTKSCVAEE